METYKTSHPCPKCGCKEILDRWHVQWNCELIWGDFENQFPDKHIHRKCMQCEFEWPETPINEKEAKS